MILDDDELERIYRTLYAMKGTDRNVNNALTNLLILEEIQNQLDTMYAQRPVGRSRLGMLQRLHDVRRLYSKLVLKKSVQTLDLFMTIIFLIAYGLFQFGDILYSIAKSLS